jgi:hypothetical protein
MPTEQFLNGIGGTITAQVSGGTACTFAVTKWEGKKSVDKHDRTHAGTGGYKVTIPGYAQLAGSGECFLDLNNLPDIAGSKVLDPTRHLSGGTSDPTKYWAGLILNLGNSGLAYRMTYALISELTLVSSTSEGCTFSFQYESCYSFTGPT